MEKKKKQPGHYCRICDERKANEKFSDKGHAAHICKSCAKLPLAERNALEAVHKIERMAGRHINESEVKWLRKRLNDPRPEVQQAAREVHHLKFRRYERGQTKKGLSVFALEFFLRGEVWDEYGDEIPVHARIFANRDGTFRLVDHAQDNEIQVAVEKPIAQKFLKSLIHEWEILFWDEDLSDSVFVDDPYLDILPEFRDYDDEEKDDDIPQEAVEAAPQGEPVCSIKLELNKGSNKEIVFYNQLHNEPQELFWALMSFFEDDELIESA